MKKVAFCCLPGLESFLSDIIKRLWEHPDFETRPCFSNNKDEIIQAVQWADVVWLEWGNEMAIQLTQHPTLLNDKHVILRLHSYEALSGYVGQIDWNRVNDIIFVCKHIQDLSIAQIAIGDTLQKNPATWIIPNGIDISRFAYKERTKGPNIAYLGAINHKKGPMLLLHAFHALFTMNKKYHLHIAGKYQDPRYRFYFKKMIKKLGMESNVHEYGEITKPENWLDDMNYIINSSVLEGHPVGIAEAMAMGIKPLIHSFVGSDNLYPDDYIWYTIPDLKKLVKSKDYNSQEYRDYIIENRWTLDAQIESILKILGSNDNRQKEESNQQVSSDSFDPNHNLEILVTGGEKYNDKDTTNPDKLSGLTSSPGKLSGLSDNLQQSNFSSPVSVSPDTLAIDWILRHTFVSDTSMIKAIQVSSINPVPYPEVTGYLVPTLFLYNETKLSDDYLKFLTDVQNKDGSFNAPGKDIPFAFDTAQVVQGFLSKSQNFKDQIINACNWIISHSSNNGRLPVPDDASWDMGKHGTVPESVHIYALPPIKKAGEIFDIPKFVKFAEKSVKYYLDPVNLIPWNQDNMLLHFYCYIIDGLIDMHRINEAKDMLDQLRQFLQPSGGLPAYHNINWVCTPGLAQAAICFYRIGDMETAEKLLNFMTMLQNPSGGFFGSYGPEADYFPIAEISWANKFFLDAWHMIKIKGHQKAIQETNVMKANGWEQTLDPDIGQIKSRIESLTSSNVLPWLTAIIDEVQDVFKEGKHTVLELGSGTAEMSAYLARNCYCEVGLIDNSQKLLDKSKELFQSLDLESKLYCLDVTENIPVDDYTYDVVFSSGLLEHFEDDQIQHIVNESARIASRKVIHLVPNSRCQPYVDGKRLQIKSGTWRWGKERDFKTLKPFFEKAGLTDIHEYSVAPDHALRFLPKDQLPQGLESDDQEGYLLVTVGYKKSKRILAVVPNDPPEAYKEAGYPDLTDYFNPGFAFDKVVCMNPWTPIESSPSNSSIYNMDMISVNAETFSKEVKNINADLIRIYDIRAATRLAIFKKQSIPVVISVHDTNKDRVDPAAIPYADRWIAKSEAVKKFLIDLKIDENKIRVIPNGIDTDLFKKITGNHVLNFKARYPNKKIILCVGRWSKQKNQETLLNTLDLLPGYVCLFVGMMSKVNHPRAYCFESIPNNELPLWYSACDCMCVPSKWEGFGIVFAEAMACETLVVTTNIAPMNEYIQSWHNGFLFNNPNDPGEIAASIKCACECSPKLKENIGILARQTVVKKFSKDRVTELELEAMTFEPDIPKSKVPPIKQIVSWFHVDQKLWNNFVMNSPDTWMYHLYEWQELLHSAWNANVYSFVIQKKDRILAMCPLTVLTPQSVMDSAFGPCGIAFHPGLDKVQKKDLFHLCMEQIIKTMKHANQKYLRIPLPSLSSQDQEWNFKELYLPYGFKDASTQTYIINLLDKNSDDIFQKFAKNMRYDIRKAEKSGIAIRGIMDNDDIDQYYKMHTATYERTGVKPHPKAYFIKMHEILGPNYVKMFIAERDGEILAADNIAIFKNSALYWTGASTDEGMKSNANKLLQWHTIQWCMEHAISYYESGEAFPDAKKNSKLAGLTFFKKHFGGKLYPFRRVVYELESD